EYDLFTFLTSLYRNNSSRRNRLVIFCTGPRSFRHIFSLSLTPTPSVIIADPHLTLLFFVNFYICINQIISSLIIILKIHGSQKLKNRRHTDGEQVHEKVLNITNNHGNTNQNHNETSPKPVGIAITKKTKSKKHWQGCGEKGSLVHCWLEYNLVQPLWKIVWRFLQKLKIQLPYDPAIPPLGICLKKRRH
uniref:Uncharacterized protein n=1 Tax=Equus caballus TaxID=9796 RepID=A0A9L0RZL1_HORSE